MLLNRLFELVQPLVQIRMVLLTSNRLPQFASEFLLLDLIAFHPALVSGHRRISCSLLLSIEAKERRKKSLLDHRLPFAGSEANKKKERAG
ncbi:hypothetical protein AQ731_07730 [Burkholderia pseudomallei]|nr:hypothetical protein AQ731_07730 [Burkholderia pseudomallei]